MLPRAATVGGDGSTADKVVPPVVNDNRKCKNKRVKRAVDDDVALRDAAVQAEAERACILAEFGIHGKGMNACPYGHNLSISRIVRHSCGRCNQRNAAAFLCSSSRCDFTYCCLCVYQDERMVDNKGNGKGKNR